MYRNEDILTEAERILKERYFSEDGTKAVLPSTSAPLRADARVENLVLPDEMRGSMPLTKGKYLVKENPHLIQWEREVRKFLRKLSPEHEHRVSAVMIYEWATGIKISELMELEKSLEKTVGRRSWRSDLRKINSILKYYFGTPYMTYIAGRKVPKAYRVKPGYLITRHRPMSLTLWTEYSNGVLSP